MYLAGFASQIPAQSIDQKKEFSQSTPWLSIYYYQKNLTSRVSESSFFFHPNGKNNPYLELETAISAFQSEDKKFGKQGIQAQCAFPARYKILKKKWPNLFKDQTCLSLKNNWIDRIAAKKISLAFTGAYTNNPASLFGHSFLVFHKAHEASLLDTSVAFLAQVDPNDNAIWYTLKGIAGGYKGYFEIKPQYVNVGVYNNGESRDIWSYQLSFTDEEIELLVLHLWELSENGSFDYYFLNRNCAFYLMAFVQAIKPQWKLVNTNHPYILPLDTLKDANLNTGGIQLGEYRPSMLKKLNFGIEQLNKEQKRQFKKVLKNPEETNDSVVLDAAIDYWKYKNYKSKTLLSAEDKILMNKTLSQRSKIKIQKPSVENSIKALDPIASHDPFKFILSYFHQKQSGLDLQFFLGNHFLDDNPQNQEDFAYIQFLGQHWQLKEQNWEFIRFNFIEIYSLEDFNWIIPKFSWNVAIDWFDQGKRINNNVAQVKTGIGSSLKFHNIQIYQFINLKNEFSNEDQFIYRPYVDYEIGGRLAFDNNRFIFNLTPNYLKQNINLPINVSWHFQTDKNNEISIKFEHDNFNKYSISKKWHF